MPGATPESVLEASATSIREVAAAQQHATIDGAALQALAAELDAGEVSKACAAVRLPLQFDTLAAEVNFLALQALLDFGSGYNDLLLGQKGDGRESRETAQFGLLGMYLQNGKIDAKLLAEFSHYSIAQYFGIETHVEESLPNLPGVTVSKPGPLAAYSAQLLAALVQTGALLQSSGCADLGTYVLHALEEVGSGGATGGQEGGAGTAAALVAKLSEALPAFKDDAEVGGKRVLFLRKAQELAFDLHQRFGADEPRLRFADSHLLGGDSGPAPLAALQELGVLRLGAEAAAAVDGGTDLTPGSELEAALRAASAEACRRLAEALNSHVSSSGGAAGGSGGDGSGDAAGGDGKAGAEAEAVSAAHVGAYLRRRADAEDRFKRLPRLRDRATVAF